LNALTRKAQGSDNDRSDKSDKSDGDRDRSDASGARQGAQNGVGQGGPPSTGQDATTPGTSEFNAGEYERNARRTGLRTVEGDRQAREQAHAQGKRYGTEHTVESDRIAREKAKDGKAGPPTSTASPPAGYDKTSDGLLVKNDTSAGAAAPEATAPKLPTISYGDGETTAQPPKAAPTSSLPTIANGKIGHGQKVTGSGYDPSKPDATGIPPSPAYGGGRRPEEPGEHGFLVPPDSKNPVPEPTIATTPAPLPTPNISSKIELPTLPATAGDYGGVVNLAKTEGKSPKEFPIQTKSTDERTAFSDHLAPRGAQEQKVFGPFHAGNPPVNTPPPYKLPPSTTPSAGPQAPSDAQTALPPSTFGDRFQEFETPSLGAQGPQSEAPPAPETGSAGQGGIAPGVAFLPVLGALALHGGAAALGEFGPGLIDKINKWIQERVHEELRQKGTEQLKQKFKAPYQRDELNPKYQPEGTQQLAENLLPAPDQDAQQQPTSPLPTPPPVSAPAPAPLTAPPPTNDAALSSVAEAISSLKEAFAARQPDATTAAQGNVPQETPGDDGLSTLKQALASLAEPAEDAGSALKSLATDVPNSLPRADAASDSAPTFAASGGYISGPGTTTSDSIPAMLSNKEFVHNAKAVEHYGVPFMNAINDRTLKFAAGGLADSDKLRAVKGIVDDGSSDTPSGIAKAKKEGPFGNFSGNYGEGAGFKDGGLVGHFAGGGLVGSSASAVSALRERFTAMGFADGGIVDVPSLAMEMPSLFSAPLADSSKFIAPNAGGGMDLTHFGTADLRTDHGDFRVITRKEVMRHLTDAAIEAQTFRTGKRPSSWGSGSGR
jgi:hypothetical protein